MKKISFIVSFLLLTAVFTAPFSVSAAENAGIKPGSFFYGFVTTFEKVNLFFTFSPEKKAEKAMKYAEKRLAEAEAVAGDKNSDAVKTAISGYEENIALAAEASKKVKDETKAENLLNLIAGNASKHQEILSDVLSKVPDEAKEAITKAIEASKKGQEEATKQIAELKGEVERLKKEVAKLKQEKDNQRTAQNQGVQKQTPIQFHAQEKDSVLKIEKCKILAEDTSKKVYTETDNSIFPLSERAQLLHQIDQIQNPELAKMATKETTNQTIGEAKYFLQLVQEEMDNDKILQNQYDSKVNAAKSIASSVSKSAYNDYYINCLDQ